MRRGYDTSGHHVRDQLRPEIVRALVPALESEEEDWGSRSEPGGRLQCEDQEGLLGPARQPCDREERDDRYLSEQLPEVRGGPFVGLAGDADRSDVPNDKKSEARNNTCGTNAPGFLRFQGYLENLRAKWDKVKGPLDKSDRHDLPL